MFDFLKRPGTGSVRPQRRTPANDLADSYAAEAGREEGQTDLRRIHLSFSGQVQGVGFRWNARNCARDIGCTGWVRNEWDGSVTMELQGTNDQIARFFTLFNEQYRAFQIAYTIDEKEDVPVVAGEPSFAVHMDY